MDWRFLLAHHPPSQYDRCVRVGRLHLCTRCLGMYPPLIAGLAVQLVLTVHHAAALVARPWERWVLVGLMAPAAWDWIQGRLEPHRGTNRWRYVTGVLLGLGLARAVYLNARTPLHGPALDAVVFLVIVVLFGTLIRPPVEDDGPGP